MQVIKRYLSEENLKRFKTDFKRLTKIINNSQGELDVAIREDYLNMYYKGNSFAKISFGESNKYKVEIHRKFFKDTDADNPIFWDGRTESNNYISLIASSTKPLFRFLQKKAYHSIL